MCEECVTVRIEINEQEKKIWTVWACKDSRVTGGEIFLYLDRNSVVEAHNLSFIFSSSWSAAALML